MKADISIRRLGDVFVVKTPPWEDERPHIEAIPTTEPIGVLWAVVDALGLDEGSRYSAKRLTILMQPGNKHHDLHPTPCADCECKCDPDRSTPDD